MKLQMMGANEANFRVISYTCVKAATKNENQIDYHQNTILNSVTSALNAILYTEVTVQ